MTTEEAQKFFDDRAVKWPKDDITADRYITEEEFMTFNEKQIKHDYSMGIAIRTIQDERNKREKLTSSTIEFCEDLFNTHKSLGEVMYLFLELMISLKSSR